MNDKCEKLYYAVITKITYGTVRFNDLPDARVNVLRDSLFPHAWKVGDQCLVEYKSSFKWGTVASVE